MAKKSKYAHVTGGLPKLDSLEPDRRNIVNAVKAEIAAPPNELNGPAQPEELPSLLVEINAHVKRIIEIQKRATGGQTNATALASAWTDVRLIVDCANGWKSSLQVLLDAYEEMMIEQMEAEEVSGLKLESGASISVNSEPAGKVTDKEAFRRWCVAPADRCMTCGGRADSLGHLDGDEPEAGMSMPFEVHPFHPGGGLEMALQLWPSSMNALTKERCLAGEPPPDGVEVYQVPMVRLNRG